MSNAQSTARALLVLGALNGALVVALGAYGAHALVDAAAAARFQTAVQYHMLHALGLVAIGVVASLGGRLAWLMWAAAAMLVGVVFFCGSLYYGAISGSPGVAGLAPLGGTSFIVGWILFAIGAWRR